MHPWKGLQDLPLGTDPGPRVKGNPADRARALQALIDTGVVKNRADLAKHLGVSRARVTQVLRHLSAIISVA